MSDVRRIMCVWESPKNEGSAYYRVGWRVLDEGATCDFHANGRDGYPVKFVPARIEYEKYTEGFRIDVFGEEGRVWASLPAQACAWEYGDE